jgi:COP9 signalosome complex subunit 6
VDFVFDRRQMWLHVQLVLINISDHCMRSGQMGAERFPRVIGCLLGQHTGRSVEICNSFEMLEVLATGDASGEDLADIDHTIYGQRREQYAETFKSLDVIGWYATGEELLARDMSLHRKFSENTEAPIFLLVNPKAAMVPGTRDLPATLFESGMTDAAAGAVPIGCSLPFYVYAAVQPALCS